MRGPIVLAMTALVTAAVACTTSHPPCYRGEYQGCFCANAASGYQACNVTEDGFQACVCDGTTPGLDGGRDAGIVVAADAEGGATTGTYLSLCGPNGECAGEGARCFEFPSKGNICTKTCTQAADCPAPSPGCTPNNGVCRSP
jgi:hypothetical protein